MGSGRKTICSSALLLLALLRQALAQHHGPGYGHSNMTVPSEPGHHGHGALSANDVKLYNMQSYFSRPEHAATLYAHIGLMVVAWAIALPLGKLCSFHCHLQSLTQPC